jgi:hypothetical protein
MSMGGMRVLLSAALLAGMIGIMGMGDAAGVLLVRTVPVGASPILAAVDEQTGRALVVDWAGPTTPASMSVLDTATGTLLRTVAIGINPRAVAVDRRARRVSRACCWRANRAGRGPERRPRLRRWGSGR